MPVKFMGIPSVLEFFSSFPRRSSPYTSHARLHAGVAQPHYTLVHGMLDFRCGLGEDDFDLRALPLLLRALLFELERMDTSSATDTLTFCSTESSSLLS